MKKEDFVEYSTLHANKTSNVRINPFWENSGVSRVEDKVAQNFSAIIQLLQNNILGGGPDALCSKEEFLLVFNFQPVIAGIYGLDCIVKSTKDIADLTSSTFERSISLIVEASSGEVMNGAMLYQRTNPGEKYITAEVPRSYGCYFKFIDVNTSYKNLDMTVEVGSEKISPLNMTTTTTSAWNFISDGNNLFNKAMLFCYSLLWKKSDKSLDTKIVKKDEVADEVDTKNIKRLREDNVCNNELNIKQPIEKKQKINM